MKRIIFILTIIAGLMTYSCLSPSDPVGVKVDNSTIINTGGYCMNLDFSDSLLFTLVDEVGLVFYKYNFSEDGEIEYEEWRTESNIANDDFTSRANIYISKNQPIAFAMSHFVHPHYIIFNREYPDAYYDIYYQLDTETRDQIRHFSIVENADSSFTVFTINRSYQNLDQHAYDSIDETHITIRNIQFTYLAEEPEPFIIGQVIPPVDSLAGFSVNAQKLFYADSLLSVTNSQLGVIVLKRNTAGGLDRLLEFDIPAACEVNTVYSIENQIFAGLSNDFGCYSVLLGAEGDVVDTLHIVDTLHFAEGYTVKGIHSGSGLLAFACGSDGVLLYRIDGEMQISEMGWLDSEYAYNVKIYDEQTILAATRAGVEIFRINN